MNNTLRISLWTSLSYDLYAVLENQKALKNTFQATTFKVEENSRNFQGLAQNWKNEIQGLFKTVQTLLFLIFNTW